MDELMLLPLEPDWIAAAHACTCNPNKIPTYPADWCAPLASSSGQSPRAEPSFRTRRVPENCAHTCAGETSPLPASSFVLATHKKLNSGLVVLTPSASLMAEIKAHVQRPPTPGNPSPIPTYKFPDQDLLAAHF